MKRVTIAVALFLSMLFGSTAYAGGKSVNVQFDTNFVSVNWSGHYRGGKQYYRMPQHRQQRRAAPRRQFRAPRQVYRPAPRRIIRHAQKRYYGHAPTRIIRHGQRRQYQRPMQRSKAWYNQQWRQKQRGMKH